MTSTGCSAAGAGRLSPALQSWLAAKGWRLHPHQAEMLERAGEPALLLIAPTGGGKTLAGFLPTLSELSEAPRPGLHTLYVSPLKALTADIARNLRAPIEGAGLKIRVEDRTGDTSQTRRRRQRVDPPHILLTTPESLALLLSYPEAPKIFAGLRRVIIDEAHALAESRRGDQLMLGLARLQAMVPDLRRVALSATVEAPETLAEYLAPHPARCAILRADPGPAPDIRMLDAGPPPWAGNGGRHAVPAVLEEIENHAITLVFHNTRAQAELFFQALWLENEKGLPIAIHHGSLSREARRRVEAAMAAGDLRAVVCTGSLDLGIDWGDVDLVIQIGAPKNIKRLVQRIGRANHRYNAPSKALLVPANRFEVVECQAALAALREGALDGEPRGEGPLDVLCQQILIAACSAPFDADQLYAELRGAGPYSKLERSAFDACLDFVATGGYALRAYDRWQRLMLRDGLWQLRDPRAAQVIRQNIGTIIDVETLKVRLKGRNGAPLGEIEESFAATLTPGDTFLMGGEVVRYEGLREMTVEVSRQRGREPKVAVFNGTKFATSTLLADRILDLFQQKRWPELPDHTAQWLELQREVSRLPERRRLLVESFRWDGREQTVVYGFAGRSAQQTLGLLLTNRMELEGLNPLGFVATDYATLIWGLDPVPDIRPLLDLSRLREGLEGWLAGNAVMKRSFRSVAIVAGLIEQARGGQRKSGRQASFSSDILYEALRRHDPDHLLLRITRREAERGLVDFGRIEAMLARVGDRIDHLRPGRLTPFAAPLMLEPGRVPIHGQGRERLLDAAARELLREAGLEP